MLHIDSLLFAYVYTAVISHQSQLSFTLLERAYYFQLAWLFLCYATPVSENCRVDATFVL